MVRRTSIDAYREIERNGLLSRRRWEVYEILYHHGPLTANGVANFFPATHNAHGSNVHARINELIEHGCVCELGKKEETTGMLNYVYDVTDDLPRKIGRIKNRKLWYGVLANKFGDINRIFKTRGQALRFQIDHKLIGNILEFEE